MSPVVNFLYINQEKKIIVTNELLVAVLVILAKLSYDSIFAYTMTTCGL